MVGIYYIRNSVNGHIYIGSTVDFIERKGTHRRLLQKSQHHCERLQRAWIKYGEESFLFEFIETCQREDLHDREQLHIDSTPRRRRYNSLDRAYSSLGYSPSKKTRKKLSDALKGRPKPEGFSEQLSKSLKGNKNALGAVRSEETRKKMSESKKGQKRTAEQRAKMGGGWRGKTLSEEHRRKMSESHKKRLANG